MDMFSGMRVSASGLAAQRMRLNAINSNIANINTTRTPEGGPYRRKDVVFESIPEAKSFGEILMSQPQRDVARVQVTDVISDRKAPLLKYEPDHPDADENGYVAYPNINMMEEYANMIQATRAFEANISAMQASKDMAMSALELGR